jgi:hypothetical protein
MAFARLDSDRIQTLPLRQRTSYLDIQHTALDPAAPAPDPGPLGPQIDQLVERITAAKKRGAAVMLAYGAHLIKNGCGPLLAALVSRGHVAHLATQGAGTIHDWEFAYLGRSSESVRDNTALGRFGSWDETGRWINLAALVGGAAGLGLGESLCHLVGDDGLTFPEPEVLAQQIRDDPAAPLTAARADLLRAMRHFKLPSGRQKLDYPCKRYSVLAACHARGVPFTVHPGIGYDIYTNHPLFHGGAIGRGAGIDARVFAHSVLNLTGGVYLSIGSAIMSPQVFEKALSLANNLRLQEGQPVIRDHAITVVDLQPGGNWDWTKGEPPKDHPAYYLRFCKTFVRMGGTFDYLCGDNRVVLANLVERLGA